MNINIRNILIYFSCKYHGDFNLIYDAIKQKERCDEEDVNKVLDTIKCKTVTIIDDDYPQCLKCIVKPPFVLYYYGNLNLVNSKYTLGIVGSRNCSAYASRSVIKFIDELSKKKDIVIVSGMALGIDSISSRQAMVDNMGLISVLGSGIDVIYPKESKSIYEYCQSEKGLVISEYPNLEAPSSIHFPLRNRIIVGISKCIIAAEGKRKSGTSITCNYALEQGKDILTLPQQIDSEYDLGNFLIHQGACGLLSVEDILESLNYYEK